MLKGEWGVVMRKLAEVGNVLVDVGEWYQANNMNEWDLPSDLRNILKSLQTYSYYLSPPYSDFLTSLK